MLLMHRRHFDIIRRAGYRGIGKALAEPIENSIHAGARNIFVIMSECVNPLTHKREINEFGILDDGLGMDLIQMAQCLNIGFTTKGRYGIGAGLPLSSAYATSNVEVYSWTEDDGPVEADEPVRRVWLDINKIKTGEQEEIKDPELIELPKQYRSFLKYRTASKTYDFTQHGTLVYWKNCDNVKPNTRVLLSEKLEFELGRIFRHFIYTEGINIKLITIGHEDSAIDVLPNDPLFVMKSNYVMGNPNDPANISERVNINCTEPIFEAYGDNNGEVIIPVSYTDKRTDKQKISNVLIRFTKVRAEFYDQTAISNGDPGSRPIGKYVKKLEGISVVRAGREIDFGAFDFYDKTNNPYHRWWGCEIQFGPELDEIFQVPLNKQFVELKDDEEPTTGTDNQLALPLWNRLAQVIQPTIMKMISDNKVLRRSAR